MRMPTLPAGQAFAHSRHTVSQEMVIDSHAHFWKYPDGSTFRYKPVQHPLSVAGLVQRMDDAGVDKVVHVTRSVMGFDNDFSLEGAAQFPDRVRVMGRFDLEEGRWSERLRSWRDNPLMVGVRFTVLPPEERWFADDVLLEPFWAEAEELGIPVAIYAPEGAAMLGRIAERHPGLRLIVDHLALRVFDIFNRKPSLDSLPLLMALRKFPNVFIKLSAIPEATVEKGPFEQSRQVVRKIYDCFGPERLMWGSNFPVISQICGYKDSLDVVRDCAFLSSKDREQILSRTAITVLDLPW